MPNVITSWFSQGTRQTTRPRCRPQLTALEDRSTPASFAGNTITLDVPGEVLTIFTSASGEYFLSSTVEVNGIAGMVSFTPAAGPVNVIDTAAGVGLAFANSSTAFAHPFTVALDNGSVGVTFTGTVGFDANSLSVTTDRAIGVSVGAMLTSTSGNIALVATGTVAGPIVGVDVMGAVQSDTGSVTISGRGGDGTGAVARYGVRVSGGGTVGTTGGAGTVNVTGTAGAGNNLGNYGVFVNGPTAAITSGGGTLNVLGTGGSGNGFAAVGVHVASGGRIAGGGAGAVNVLGTGGSGGGSHNYGVLVQGANSLVTADAGTLAVTGYGGEGGLGGVGLGVYLVSGGRVVGGSAGGLVLTGVGGGLGGWGNHGVYVAGYAEGAPAAVSSGGGPVAVTGFGGGGPIAANGTGMGVHLALGGRVSAGGSGSVDVTGYGGPSSGFGAFGVLVQNSYSEITSGGGNVSVRGWAGANQTGGLGTGVFVNASGSITAGGTGTLSVFGDGGATIAQGGYGVFVTGPGSVVTSNGGVVAVTGTGGGNGGSGTSVGVLVADRSTITSGANSAVTVSGTGLSSGFSMGVLVQNGYSGEGTTSIRSGGGTLTVTGIAGGASAQSVGVSVSASYLRPATIAAGGQGALFVTGTGGGASNPANSVGVRVSGYDFGSITAAVITSDGGPVTIRGYGRDPAGSGRGNGVFVTTGGTVTGNGTGGAVTVEGTGYHGQGVMIGGDYYYGDNTPRAPMINGAAAVTVKGTVLGDATSESEYGVFIYGQSTQLTASGAGTLSIIGSHSNGNTGVLMFMGAKIVTGGQPVIITSDSFELLQGNYGPYYYYTPSVNVGTGTLTLQPLTPGTKVDVGGADELTGSPRTLGLSATDLSRITAGTLILGSNIAGTMTLSADITRTAPTNVQLVTGGDLTTAPTFGRLNTAGGSVAFGVSGSLFPLQAGVDFLASQVTASPITLALAVNGTTPDTQYQQLNVTGDLYLLGFTLSVSGSYVPVAGDVFTLATATNLYGTFNGLADGAFVTLNGVNLRINYTPTAATATVV